MKTIHVSLVFLAFALVGCANMNTLARRTDLPDGGKAVHLDAPQRLVYVNAEGKVCAEPSPDALQAYASSLGMSVTKPDGGAAAELAAALSGSSAGLGLRTQAITLMRDNLYRTCEAEHNGALENPAVVQLLERSQDLSLGVLAIEQLTGAVVARQPVINMGSNAEASANINKTQKELDQAKQDQTAKEETLTKAKEEQTKAQSALDDAQKAELSAKAKAAVQLALIDQLTPKLKDEQGKLDTAFKAVIDTTTKYVLENEILETLRKELDQAKTEEERKTIQPKIKDQETKVANAKAASDAADTARQAQQAKVDEHQRAIQTQQQTDEYKAYDVALKDRKAKQDASEKAKSNVTAAQSSVDQAKKVVESLQSNLNAAITSVKASTTADGSSIQASDRNNINKDTVAQISAATENIVKLIVNKGRLTDVCASILTAAASNGDKTKMQLGVYGEFLLPCKNVFEADIRAYLARIGTGGQGSDVGPLSDVNLEGLIREMEGNR